MSSIEWTNKTWNPVIGCSKVSPGCAHCYAEALHAQRFDDRCGYPAFRPWTPANAEHNVTLRPERLNQPRTWRTPQMVFVNSMSDLFHELVPFAFIDKVWETMEACPQHIFQILTKRPERMREYMERCAALADAWLGEDLNVLPNVWLGTSIENRRFVGRADHLRATPAAVRFISAEPLLGPLIPDDLVGSKGDLLRPPTPVWSDDYNEPGLDLTGIDWLIVGGESGPGFRRMDHQWVRDLLGACHDSGTYPFVKQMGGLRPGDKFKSLPQEFQIREWPRQLTEVT